jgi:hypothetical protein
MKKLQAKTSQPRKLVLNQETIASLTRDELALIAGGVRATDTGSGVVCLTFSNQGCG